MDASQDKTFGLPPGSLATFPGAVVPEHVHLIRYSADACEERDVTSLTEIAEWGAEKESVLWVNIDGLGNVRFLTECREILGYHPLALEDALNVQQRPKADDYDTHLFVVMRMLSLNEIELDSEQISVFLGDNCVVTFQEREGDCLDVVRQRIRKGSGQIRSQKADYLMYTIIDAVIDSYFPVLESIGDVVEMLEDEVVMDPSNETLGRVHRIKRSLLDLRRATWPLRDAVSYLLRDESPLVSANTRLYFRDCHDHVIQVIDITETYRELASSLMDVYLSSISNRMNEVMKVLTVIATIFIPLTFIAGIYGMNFEVMPELKWRWGYGGIWAVMVSVTGVMLAFFARKGWLGGRR